MDHWRAVRSALMVNAMSMGWLFTIEDFQGGVSYL
jgi:hypothetical protein